MRNCAREKIREEDLRGKIWNTGIDVPSADLIFPFASEGDKDGNAWTILCGDVEKNCLSDLNTLLKRIPILAERQ
jgi:hypothetical protein